MATTIPNETIKAIEYFCDIDSKENILARLDNIIRYSVVSGLLKDYNIENELSVLFEVKDMIKEFPFKQ